MSSKSFMENSTIFLLNCLPADLPITDVRDLSNRSPLHIAAKENDLKVADYLIKAGCNINAVDKEGRTPLLYAIFKKSHKMVKLLLRAGTNLDIEDNSGRTALFYAKPSEKISMFSLEREDLQERCLIKNLLNALYKVKVYPELVVETLLHAEWTLIDVVKFGNVELINALVNVKHYNREELNFALFMAITLSCAEKAKVLLQNGADALTSNDAGHVLLNVAVECSVLTAGGLECVRVLLEHSTVPEYAGKEALFMANLYEAHACVQLLMEFGVGSVATETRIRSRG